MVGSCLRGDIVLGEMECALLGDDDDASRRRRVDGVAVTAAAGDGGAGDRSRPGLRLRARRRLGLRTTAESTLVSASSISGWCRNKGLAAFLRLAPLDFLAEAG